MKNLIIIFLVFVTTSASAQFRNTTWGMSKEQVKKIEKEISSPYHGPKLFYTFNIDDLAVKLEYSFNNNDELKTITYSFVSASGSNDNHVWEKTINSIIEKYGEPSSKPNSNVYNWDLKNFSIKAISNERPDKVVNVIYTPPAPSLKDIL